MADETIPRHKNARNDLTVERCREVFDYDPETGFLRWKISPWANTPIGSVAGGIVKSGKGFKVRVGVDTKRYLAHRLIWLWVTGEWPTHEVDHEDTDGTNNRWRNLRHATSAQNMRNRGVNKNNSSGMKGAHYSKKTGKYIAHIGVGGKSVHLGVFNTSEEANSAYKEAAILLYGEFARWE